MTMNKQHISGGLVAVREGDEIKIQTIHSLEVQTEIVVLDSEIDELIAALQHLKEQVTA